MRVRIERQHPAKTVWEVKYARGGLVDIEFIAQYLQLRHAHARPDVLSPNTADALCRVADAGLLDRTVAADLLDALHLWQRIQAYLRLTHDGAFEPAAAPAPLKAGLARAAFPERESIDFTEAETLVAEAAARASGH